MRRTLVVLLVLASIVLASCTSSATSGSDECDVLVGPEPWLILFTEESSSDKCVVVGVHQDLQIWNKGFEPLTIEWLGDKLEIASDDKYETGPLADVLEPGIYALEASPYPAPNLRVLSPAESVSGRTKMTIEGFGGVSLGMSLAEAAEALDNPIEIDPDLYPGRDCSQAVVVGDPYSPIFTVDGDRDSASITAITTFYPLGEQVTISSPNDRVTPLCLPFHE